MMHIDWSLPIGTIILFAAQFVGGLVAFMRAVSKIEKSIDSRFSDMKITMTLFKEGDLRDMQGRLTRLEMGSDEWTKALRDRTHEHANEINAMKLKIDRLERPERYNRRTGDTANE